MAKKEVLPQGCALLFNRTVIVSFDVCIERSLVRYVACYIALLFNAIENLTEAGATFYRRNLG